MTTVWDPRCLNVNYSIKDLNISKMFRYWEIHLGCHNLKGRIEIRGQVSTGYLEINLSVSIFGKPFTFCIHPLKGKVNIFVYLVISLVILIWSYSPYSSSRHFTHLTSLFLISWKCFFILAIVIIGEIIFFIARKYS